MKKTILIFGISSFVGSNLAQFLKDEFRIVGTYHRSVVDVPGITCIPCDVLRKDSVANLVGLVKPDFTIYAVGLSSLTESKRSPKLADALNTVGAVNCCTGSERHGSKFIFISSGFVLSGEDVVFKEGDTPFPGTAYGNSLSSSGFFVQRSCLNYFILRCSPLYGRSFNWKHPNWFEFLQTALAKTEKFEVDDTVVTGFLDIWILAKIIKAALNQNVTNRLYQISSQDWMTRYEFARLYARIFKKDEGLVQRVSVAFPFEEAGGRGHNKVLSKYAFKLDVRNIEEFLGAKMPSIEESLQLSYQRLSAKFS